VELEEENEGYEYEESLDHDPLAFDDSGDQNEDDFAVHDDRLPVVAVSLVALIKEAKLPFSVNGIQFVLKFLEDQDCGEGNSETPY